jgi:Rieske 2Fe-2S family protein
VVGSTCRPSAPLDVDALDATRQPFGRARMLPREAYVDPEVLAWERRHLFDGGWVCVGRSAELTGQPGDQAAVRVGATSVLLTCDATGRVRAFANICRHRGHELLACATTTRRGVVQCPYHAWSYGLDGGLRVAPHAGAMSNVVPDELGLVPVSLARWAGWLFVNVDGLAAPFDEHIGGLADLLAPWGPDGLRVAATHHYEVAANWKVVVENYHECAHSN